MVFLETRDRRVTQDLDPGSGNFEVIPVIHFLFGHELAVVGGRGEVTFFAA